MLAAVLMHVGTDGSPCTASVKTLSEIAGVTPRAVTRTLSKLVGTSLERTDVIGVGIALRPLTNETGVPPTERTGVNAHAPLSRTSPLTQMVPLPLVSPKGEEQRTKSKELFSESKKIVVGEPSTSFSGNRSGTTSDDERAFSK